ncbi:MAG: ADP-ribosyl-(dinitrogen reductase) hydrolase [Bdellovibrionales bacterium]
MRIIIYPLILEKLRNKHGVSADEVEQAFLNRTEKLAKEVRERHQGDEPRWWFISTTDVGRELKVVFVQDEDGKTPVIITAFEPNDDEVKLYEKIQRQETK